MKFNQLKQFLEKEDIKDPAEIKQDQDINKLVNFIKSHGHKAWVDGNEIKAIEELTNKDGEAESEEVTLKPNLAAVRKWLGY